MTRYFMKSIVIGVLVLLLSACGAPLQSKQVSLESETRVMIVADKLVNAMVSLNGNVVTLTKGGVQKYKYGVLGVADKNIEGKEIAYFDVEPGKVVVKIEMGGVVVFQDELYFVEGQLREIKL